MRKQIFCEHCGAKVFKYKHSLNSGLAIGLSKLQKKNKSCSLKELDLTVNQFNNFQKLQYWGFVEKDKSIPGNWLVTDQGNLFLAGMEFPKTVVTFRGKVVEYLTDKMITIHDLREAYKKKLEYINDREVHL